MAATGPKMSGEFVPAREWTCPNHERPEQHWCDCEFCTWEEPACCAAAEWIDKIGEDGEVVMRELPFYEAMLRKFPPYQPRPIHLTTGPNGYAIEWVEDLLLG